ncbi:UDP-glucose 4-epimerase GalE [Deinococcus cellulosilyticus]|uniref:UDP-glucose 4-epimerase n=1 Tax=Deinococcus cellulosilyticus (strain DSM 18568 / NBRC 106333 / KACC 11606 / 5516J-15) TaxID=1223518 RepID=A0A511N538_DEIC1|nr:UDP-glucose 4-epimerase GalE [Deinococcus cellulosilyticus]GEM47587.1 UDP-glucose 4-epimerase GalE [Deinococcus cellulosilyticus NBRC 106333 = KACC 11606]
MTKLKVLVTGGAGFIGSTICSALLDAGHTPVILDNLVTGRKEFTVDRIFYQGDIADQQLLRSIFDAHPDIDSVIHCAALIVVPDSVRQPYEYYVENVEKSLHLFRHLLDLGCHKIIYSSSASIYDSTSAVEVDENAPLQPLSPYARTKQMVEMILQDFAVAYQLQSIVLRYFNPIGADPQLRTGLQLERPSHALGKIIEAYQSHQTFYVTGTQWPTRDGSGIRDYIHVWDLALAHVQAVELFDNILSRTPTHHAVYNIGTGQGVTVYELVQAFEEVTGLPLAHEAAPPRPGDSAGTYTISQRASTDLQWSPQRTLQEGIAHALEWAVLRKEKLLQHKN